MSIDDEFIQTILASPDDDMPRLVYADWLDEQGDPRGEFIRIQCLLAQMSQDNLQRWDLELRQHRLLRWYGWQWWHDPFNPQTNVPRFHRGFPEEFGFDVPRFLSRAEMLFERYPLFRRLTIPSADAADMTRLAHSPLLGRIVFLDLSGSNIGGRGTEVLGQSPHAAQLSGLILVRNGLGDQSARALTSSPHLAKLKRLDLRENEFSKTARAALQLRFGDGVQLDPWQGRRR